MSATIQEIAEAQAAKDRELLAALQGRVTSATLPAPNRAARRRSAVNPKLSSSTIARARRKIRRRIAAQSKARNRA